MKKEIITSLFLLTCTWIEPAQATRSAIDPIKQIYFVTEADRIDHAHNVSLRRIYSSATVFRGYFGAGWCSELDARIVFFSEGEARFRSCDLESASTVDRRLSESGIKETPTGFRRTREDGVIQIFSREGSLDRLIAKTYEIQVARDREHRPVALGIKSRGRTTTVRIGFESKGTDPAFALITEIGPHRFQYQNGLLVSTPESQFRYDDLLNLIGRVTDKERETLFYDTDSDRLMQVVRSGARGQERIEIESRNNGIEIIANIERGAETRPVRILYDARTHDVSLEGDERIARWVLTMIGST